MLRRPRPRPAVRTLDRPFIPQNDRSLHQSTGPFPVTALTVPRALTALTVPLGDRLPRVALCAYATRRPDNAGRQVAEDPPERASPVRPGRLRPASAGPHRRPPAGLTKPALLLLRAQAGRAARGARGPLGRAGRRARGLPAVSDVRKTLSDLAWLILKRGGVRTRATSSGSSPRRRPHPEVGRAFSGRSAPSSETRLLGEIRPAPRPDADEGTVLALFPSSIGSLAHYSPLPVPSPPSPV